MVCVQLYADPIDGGEPARHVLTRRRRTDGPGDGYEFDVSVPAVRPVGDYTLRLLPFHPAAAVPLEAHEILWQR